jgi:Cu2+-containing amine oxidase
VFHPLQPLTRDEISEVSAIVRAEMAELGETLRFETIELREPAKSVVREFEPGDPITREARVNVYRTGDIGVWRLMVSITDGEILSKEVLPDACPMIQLEEFLEIEAAIKRDPAFIEACAKRGITDMSLVCVDPQFRRRVAGYQRQQFAAPPLLDLRVADLVVLGAGQRIGLQRVVDDLRPDEHHQHLLLPLCATHLEQLP